VGALSDDGIHPNVQGSAVIAAYVRAQLPP
jgi:hypothetical protein